MGRSNVDPRLQATRQAEVNIRGLCFKLACLDDLDADLRRLLRDTESPAVDAASELCPHFGVLWPSAVALIESMCDRYAGDLRGRRVLELGCGLALPSMVASRLQAAQVIATDRHIYAQALLVRNLAQNALSNVEYVQHDWRKNPATKLMAGFDLLIASDVLYEAWQPAYLAQCLRSLLASDGCALIADPGRRHLDAFRQHCGALELNVQDEERRIVRLGRSPVAVTVLAVSAAS